MHVYESFCTPLCKKYQLNQSDLDLILFIANNPMYNTAKDVCEIRGIKKGIVSVTTERLVQSGYLIRKNDIHDRRIQRLCLTEKCQPIIADGREMQTHFFTEICFSALICSISFIEKRRFFCVTIYIFSFHNNSRNFLCGFSLLTKIHLFLS